MNRTEERLVWARALELDLGDCDIPRLASPEGMSEVTGMLFTNIKQGRRPLSCDFRRFNREHLQALKSLRFLIAGEILSHVPNDGLTARLSEIKLQRDVGL
ncbi:hypothetical protein [Pseudomonas sp. CBC3]|uniref:hypothetical protein n=1 Tax=Pseudomonas sp. CBC3 TaxID=3123318 RepID=UPI0030E7805C